MGNLGEIRGMLWEEREIRKEISCLSLFQQEICYFSELLREVLLLTNIFSVTAFHTNPKYIQLRYSHFTRIRKATYTILHLPHPSICQNPLPVPMH